MQYDWNSRKLYRVSFVTTCMGRLYHLKETIVKNIENNRSYPNFEYVLLDYNSPDGLEDWAKTHLRRYIDAGILNYYKTTEPRFFHMSHAKNVAHLLATGDIVANVDGDNLVGVGYADHLNDMFTENKRSYCRCGRTGDNGTGGRVALMRNDFLQFGGYEEKMIGWGYEDADLVMRARRHRLFPAFTNSFWCKAIQHDDASRERYHTPPDHKTVLRKRESITHNQSLYDQNRQTRAMFGNKDRVWGAAKVVKNFRFPMEISSEVLLKADRGNQLASRLPQPASEDILSNDPPLPQVESPPPEKQRSVGFFSISSNLKIRQVPFPKGIPSTSPKKS